MQGNLREWNKGDDKLTQPKNNVKVGGVEVAVWENQKKEGKGTFVSFSVQRNYKQGEEWKHSQSFFLNDVPKLVIALQEAYKAEVLKAKESDA